MIWKKNATSLANNLWKDHVCMFELRQIVRQKDDLNFAALLNRLMKKLLSDEGKDELKNVR